jgi:hypothetical protein
MNPANVRALVSKELHHLLPLIFALIALEILGLLEWFIVRSPDAMSWAEVSVLLDASRASVAGTTYIIVGIVAAYLLFPPEEDQNTLQFLWSLPVARRHIYMVKIGTALGVLAGLLVAGHILLWWLHTFGASSISRAQFSWGLWTQELVSLIGVVAIALGYGALIATFRIIGVLGFLALWGLALVFGSVDPSLQYLNVSTLLVPEYRGSNILLNSKTWIVHATLACGCALLAGYRWTRDRQPAALRKRSSRLGSRLAMGLSALLALLLIVGYGTSTLAPGLTDAALGRADSQAQLESIETQYYEISYYALDRPHAQILQKEADQRSQQVQQLLGMTSSDLILADLTDTSADHLGIAGWKKLRIRRSALYDPEQRSHVFVHETTHVLAAAASDRRLSEHNSYALFFSEGLAEWASYEILGLPEQRQALRLLAALAWQRFNLRFDDFLYASAFRARFDESLIYALGEAWVSALAQVCGNQAPGAALQAMARPNAPRQLAGGAFWRDTLQASGCDLSAVNGRFSLWMRDYRSELNAVPILTGAIEATGEQLLVTLMLNGPKPGRAYKVSVRVRDNPNASPAAVYSQSAELKTGERITLKLPQYGISGERFQYQLGVEFLPGQRSFFGRWIDEG